SGGTGAAVAHSRTGAGGSRCVGRRQTHRDPARPSSGLHRFGRVRAGTSARTRRATVLQSGAAQHPGGRVPTPDRQEPDRMTTTENPRHARVPVHGEVRVLGWWRSAWLWVERQWTWYRRYWTSNLYSSGLQPLLFLLAMGLGFGSQVDPGVLGTDTYVQYVAPALLVAGSMQFAVGESTYPVLSGFRWNKAYFAVTSTPITPGQVLGGHLIWVGLRLMLAAGVYAVIAAFFGA